MKRIIYFIIASLFLLIPMDVFAASTIATCNYDKVRYTDDSYFKFKLDIYDDKSYNLSYYDNTETLKSNYSSLAFLALYDNTGKNIGSVNTFNWSKGIDPYDFYKSDGKCPVIEVDISSYTITLDKETSYCGSDSNKYCSSATSSSQSSNSSNTNAVNLTKSCSNSIDKGNISAVGAMNYKLNMYSNGKKELCLQADGNRDFSCSYVDSNSDPSVCVSAANGTATGYNICISSNQVSKMFNQVNMAQIDNNTFSCPTKVYVAETNGYTSGMYELTTDASNTGDGYSSEAHTGTSSDLDKNNSSDSSSGTNIGTDIGYGGTQVENTCEGLLGTEMTEYLQKIFNYIKVIGPVMALLLGMIDFIKATASGEDDTKKKAIKNVKNRLIAAFALFLVPVILQTILSLVDGFSGTCGIG